MTTERATSAPFPSTPVGKQGAIPIATRVEPPAVASRVAEDFIVYPHHLVFSVEPKNDSQHAWKTGMPLTARQARVGEAARSMCNFHMFGDTTTATSIESDYNIRFLGVSYEGTPDYRAAQASPDSNGRFSVSISGKATIFCDTRTLRNAKIGDVIVAYPRPAKFTWQDGSRKFNPPDLGFYSPSGLYSRSTHAGALVAQQLICDGPMTPYEYDYAFRTFKDTTVTPEMYPEIRAAIGSFRGHRYVGTPESKADVANAALSVLITNADVARRATDFITNNVGDDKAMRAAMALACGRKYAFKDSSGERVGTVPGATADEQRALEELVTNVAGEGFDDDKAIQVALSKDDMNKLIDDISKHRRGYPLLGIAAAQQSSTIAAKLADILDEGRTTSTSGSFHQHAGQIRTAAMMAGRPAKRIRTSGNLATSGHMGGGLAEYVIGTLVELGDWSGRPNECSILIDPRLGL